MKLNIRASLAFKRGKSDSKPGFGNNVINCLTAAAAQFPALPVSLAQLKTINTALATAITNALSGNRTAILQLKAAVSTWNDAFTKTANYVSTVAAGDGIVVSNAGFVPTKGESTPAPKPGAAADFKATINGSKGAIVAGSKKGVPQAKGYVYVATQDGVTVNFNDGIVEIKTGDKSIYITAATQRQTEFFNLPRSTAFNVTMYALNSAGSGPAAAAQEVVTQ